MGRRCGYESNARSATSTPNTSRVSKRSTASTGSARAKAASGKIAATSGTRGSDRSAGVPPAFLKNERAGRPRSLQLIKLAVFPAQISEIRRDRHRGTGGALDQFGRLEFAAVAVDVFNQTNVQLGEIPSR